MEIYVIGHKNPDTDSVISAMAAAKLMGYKPAIFGKINKETAFILEKFNVKAPESLTDISGKKVFLVDHNENTQMADGWEKAEIIGVLDHHKINFSSSSPVFFHAETLGSTSSIIAKTYAESLREDPVLSGLLLSGILSDTIILKSPTTTEEDKAIAAGLATIAGIKDMVKWGEEIKAAGADIEGRSISDIVGADFKDFDMNGKKIGVGQIELPDIAVLDNLRSQIITRLEEIKSTGYEFTMMILTDITQKGSALLFAGRPEVIKESFGVDAKNNAVFIEGIVSRKKQVIPKLEAVFNQ